MQWNELQLINRKKGVPWQEIDNNVLILSPENNMAHELNKTASFLWKQLDENSSYQNLVNEMTRCFNVEEETAKKDISKLLTKFYEKGLIEWQ